MLQRPYKSPALCCSSSSFQRQLPFSVCVSNKSLAWGLWHGVASWYCLASSCQDRLCQKNPYRMSGEVLLRCWVKCIYLQTGVGPGAETENEWFKSECSQKDLCPVGSAGNSPTSPRFYFINQLFICAPGMCMCVGGCTCAMLHMSTTWGSQFSPSTCGSYGLN